MTGLKSKELLKQRQYMSLTAGFVGFSMWLPAIGLPAGPTSLQIADIVSLCSWPLAISYLPRLCWRSATVILLSLLSIILSFIHSGDPFVFIYYILFMTPFMILISVIIKLPDARWMFLKWFVVAGVISCFLSFLQISIGSSLDFRTNTNFSSPIQSGRGYAFFPEASTFATHVIYLLGVSLFALRSGVVKRFFKYGGVAAILILAAVAVTLSRSSSVILIAPAVFVLSYLKGRPMTYTGVLGLLIAAAFVSILLQLYVENFYADRAAGSALRSIWLRGITMLAGFSVIPNGEVFGVGLGNNGEVTTRSFEVARSLGFQLILLPEGVNSFIIARIFEEGWMALLLFIISSFMLFKLAFRGINDPVVGMVLVMAFSSFLISGLVTGYRGIYMNWFWIAAAPSLATVTLPRNRATNSENGEVNI